MTDLLLGHLVAVFEAAGCEFLAPAVAPHWPAIVTQHAATHVPSRPGGPA